MRIPSGSTDRYVYFVAVDSIDLKTRETGLTTFTVYGSKNGAAAAAFTSPTVNETDASNMPGVYELLLDEQTTLTAGNDTEELCLHITQASMAPVTRVVEIYRPETTEGNTLDVNATGEAGLDYDNTSGTIGAADLATDTITADKIAADAITSSEIADNAITAAKINAAAITSAKFGAGAVDANALATDAAGEIADAVWDEAKAGHVGAGSFGEEVQAHALSSEISALNDLSAADVNAEVDTALSDVNLDHLVGTAAPGIPPTGTYLDILADDGTATYDRTTDSLQALRDRGDAAWTTGGGGSISDILNVVPMVPPEIDLADTATVRIGLMLTNAIDDLPSTAEIDPGTIDIHRKAYGGTSWTLVVNGAACSELAGQIFYDEVFDSGSTYAAGDSLRITFKGQKITVAANDYEISDASGRMFYSTIREEMRGTDSAALASVCTEARLSELDAATAGKAANQIDEIRTDTAEIGTAGAGLTNINLPNQTMDITGDITGNVSGSVGSVTGAVGSVTGAVGSVTGNVGGNVVGSVASVSGNVDGNVAGSVGSLAAQAKTDVNAEVERELKTDTSTLPAQGAPSATPTIEEMITWLYKAFRNKKEQTATTWSLYNDAGDTVDSKATVADDGSTASKAEIVSGP